MKVIGFQTSKDPAAPPGEQYVHLAVLECGHLQRVGHGHVPSTLKCLEGCDELIGLGSPALKNGKAL